MTKAAVINNRRIAPAGITLAAGCLLAACGGGGSGKSFPVGGNVSGLEGTGLVLSINGGDPLPIATAGSFTFPAAVAAGSPLTVAVVNPPANPSQTCVVSNDTGIVSGPITDIAVTCTTNDYTIGGSVAGLQGTGLVLQNNGADDLRITANGMFAFDTPVASGNAYAVSVSQQPTNPAQHCVVVAANASGTATSSNVTAISVVCASVSRFLYLADEMGNQLFGFSIDASSGALTSLPASPFGAPNSPAFPVADPLGRFLYAASDVTTSILGYAINPATGALTALAPTALPGLGVLTVLAIDPTGRYLYAEWMPSGGSLPLAVAAFSINATTGALTPVPGSPFMVDSDIVGMTPITIDPSDRFLYISYNRLMQPVRVAGFRIDPQTGALAALPGGPVQTNGALIGSPVSSSIDPSGRHLYVAQDTCSFTPPQPCSEIGVFDIDPSSGVLTPTTMLTNFASSLSFSPGGQWVYAVNMTLSTDITTYDVDPKTFAFSAAPGNPYSNPDLAYAPSVIVDPSGAFAYVPVVGPGITVFRIDPISGVLNPVPGSPFPTAVLGSLVLSP